MTSRLLPLVGLLLLAPAARAADAKPGADDIEFFEKHVRPLLVENCQGCHGPAKQRGGLRLDTRAGLLKGGDTGPAVVPGKPDGSLLIKAVLHEGERKMPPKGKLDAAAVDVLKV